MRLRASSTAAWIVCGFAGAAIAALAVTIEVPAQSSEHIQSAQHDHDGHRQQDGASDGGGATFYSEMDAVNARMHADMAISPDDDIDRDFMRMMIPHHQGAIDMARVLLKYGHDEKLKRLAQSIIVEQAQEIAYMRVLLDPPRALTPETHLGADK
jgi:uncharacterized protein (DUF305 family)